MDNEDVKTVDNGVADPTQQMWELAERIAPAKFIPEAIRGDVPSVFYMLHTAADLGLKWTFAFRTMYLDREGELAMKGAAVLALLQLNKFKVEFIPSAEGQPIGCACRITRPGEDQAVERSFTMADAARIKTHWNGERWVSLAENPWYQNHGPDMCQWRCLARCGRVAAADLTGGIYLPEELQENRNTPGAPPPPEPDSQFVVGEKPEPETEEAPIETKPPVAETVPTESTPPSNVVEIPAAPAAEAPVAVTKPTFDENIALLSKKIGGDTDRAHKAIADYFRGYLSVQRLPRDVSKMEPALDKLLEVIDARLEDLKADPMKLGSELSGAVAPPSITDAEFARLKWPPHIQKLVRSIQNAIGQSDKMLVDWISSPIVGDVSVASLPVEALEIFLPIFILVRGRAWELIEWAVQNNQPITQSLVKITAVVGKPVSEWDAKTALDVINGMPKTKPAPATKPKPQPNPDDDALPFG